MAKKRGNGEGSIHKRSNGTWEVQVSSGRSPVEPDLQDPAGMPGMAEKDPRPD